MIRASPDHPALFGVDSGFAEREETQAFAQAELAEFLLFPNCSIQPEIHLNVHLHCDRDAVFNARSEPPLPYRVDGFFVQPHAQRARDSNVAGLPLRINHQRKYHHSLVFHPSRFV